MIFLTLVALWFLGKIVKLVFFFWTKIISKEFLAKAEKEHR